MEKISFYWNWLARVAQASNAQRNVAMKMTTTKSKTNGKTAILAVATIIAVALTTQTTGPSAQSLPIPELPDLPDPGPAPEPVFPPVPPGTFTCSEYFASVRPMLDDQDANLKKAIERTYNAKCAPFEILRDSDFRLIDAYNEQIKELRKQKNNLLQIHYPNYTIGMLQIDAKIKKLGKMIDVLIQHIADLNDELGKIYDWYKRMLEWAQEKYEKAVDALENQTRDCLDNERDDD